MESIRYYLYFVLGKIRHQYFMQIPENDQEYKRSRMWFIVDGASAVTIGVLVGGAFLAAILRTLGISDSFNGIISAIPSLASIIQLIGIEFAKRMHKIKLFVCILAIIHRLMFAFLYAIPFLKMSITWKVILCILTFLTAHTLGQMIAPAAGNWISSLVSEDVRGKYFANRDCIMVLVSITVALGTGQVFDRLKAWSNPDMKFLFVSLQILVLAIINFIALSNIKEPRFSYVSSDNKEMHGKLVEKRGYKESNEHCEKFWVTFKQVISNKSFRSSIILTVLWQSAFFFSTPYFGIYQISYLKLSYTYIMIMGFAGSLIRIILTPIGGKVADKKSWALVLKTALSVMAFAFIINGFTVPTNSRMMFTIYSILTGAAWAGVAPGLFAIQLDLAPDGDKTAYLGVNAAIMGVCGFLSALAGGYILHLILDRGNQIWGYRVYGQQILSWGSGVLILVLVAYIKWRFKKFL
ncbi:MFS transporter [Cellulosilyticum sp. I15G10I2]|uniref:MFS transporter n=1 Tax=Cellulosilyticum sp. I15G10I2 TaxID=1892843 RepID=UPI00085CD12A|nr:MFS transporter [Cellulosilyticum sp. I15G10I2]